MKAEEAAIPGLFVASFFLSTSVKANHFDWVQVASIVFTALGLFFALYQSFISYKSYSLNEKQIRDLELTSLKEELTGQIKYTFQIYSKGLFLVKGNQKHLQKIESELKETKAEVTHLATRLSNLEFYLKIKNANEKTDGGTELC